MKTSYGWKLLPYLRPYRLRFFWELDFPFCRQKPDLPPVYDVLSAAVAARRATLFRFACGLRTPPEAAERSLPSASAHGIEDMKRVVVNIGHRLLAFDVVFGADIPHRRLRPTDQDQKQALGDGRLGQIFTPTIRSNTVAT
jgi:hypothetical protein